MNNESQPAVNKMETNIPVYPEHIEVGENMDRELHRMINTVRSPLTIKSRDKRPEPVKLYTGQVIATAVVNTETPTRINGCITNKLPLIGYRHMSAEGEILVIGETVTNSCALSDALFKSVPEGISSIYNTLCDFNENQDLTEADMSMLQLVNTYLTDIVNDYIRATVDKTWSIDSFMCDMAELHDLMVDKGFDEFEMYMNKLILLAYVTLLTAQTNGNSSAASPNDVGVPVGSLVVTCLNKSCYDMGFNEITKTDSVSLSSVYHPTLITLLNNIYEITGIPRVILYLTDSAFVLYKAPIAFGSWCVNLAG